MLKLGRKSQTLSPSADCVFDDPEVLEEPQPKQKDTGVTDVLKRLSISLRPLPAFESEGEPYTEEGSAMDGKVAQALSVGSHNGSDNPTSESDNISKSERYSQRRFKGYGSRMEALLLAINAIHDRVGTDEDQSDFETLKNIIQSPEAKKAIEVDEMMRGLIHGDSGRPRPVDKHLIPSAVLFRSAMKRYNEPTPEIKELRQLMRSPHIQGIFFCHDRVATDEDQSDFETLKNIIQSPEAKKAIEVDELSLIHI